MHAIHKRIALCAAGRTANWFEVDAPRLQRTMIQACRSFSYTC